MTLILSLCVVVLMGMSQKATLGGIAAQATRQLARGDDIASVRSIADRALHGATIRVSTDGEFICAHVGSPPGSGPDWWGKLIGESHSCALREESDSPEEGPG